MKKQKKTGVTKAISETRYINRTLVICYTIAVVLGLAGYLSSLIKAPQEPLAVTIWITSCVLPCIICNLAFFIKKESKYIQYFMPFGYLIFYLTSIISETEYIYIYVYIFPVLIILIVCNNIKLIYIIGGITIAINIFDAVTSWSVVTEAENLSRMAMVGICASFAVFAARVTDKLTQKKLSIIESEKNATEEMMNVINAETEKMGDAIGELNDNKQQLSESVASTTSVVSGINAGMHDAVNSIQQQLEATENIKQLVEVVKNQVVGMDGLMKNTDSSVEDGSSQITALSESTDTLRTKNSVILQEVNELEVRAGEVRNIVEIINGIADQTRLLSLNASIEAARAGEHGRGFSVVANEINNLSNQTGDSINRITEIIDILNNEIQSMKSAVDDMMSANELQNTVINKVADSFTNIRECVGEVKNDMSSLTINIDNVSSHTESIVTDAANVSAVSEEVLASTNEADLICERNSKIVNTISEIANVLQNGADNLKNKR